MPFVTLGSRRFNLLNVTQCDFDGRLATIFFTDGTSICLSSEEMMAFKAYWDQQATNIPINPAAAHEAAQPVERDFSLGTEAPPSH